MRLLKVLTLNTWGFRWPLAKHRARRFRHISDHLDREGYDIVGLQELWDGATEFVQSHSLRWPLHPFRRRKRRLRIADSGLGVKVSPQLHQGTEIVGHAVRSYSEHRGWDRVKRKGVLCVDVPTEVGSVCVMNTHLQASPQHGRIRRRQLEELLEVAEGLDAPIVLMGDFNFHRGCDEDRAAHRFLERHGFRDAGEHLDQPKPTYLTSNPYVDNSEDERFDRIYLRDGAGLQLAPRAVEVIVDHDAPMSDHQAVSADIVLTRV